MCDYAVVTAVLSDLACAQCLWLHFIHYNTPARIRHIWQKFKYKSIDIHDIPSSNIFQYFLSTNEWIHNARSSGHPVLVHCAAGVSRSASLCIAYLMEKQNMSLKAAFDHLRKCRQCICPNAGFMRQLRQFEEYLKKRTAVAKRKAKSKPKPKPKPNLNKQVATVAKKKAKTS